MIELFAIKQFFVGLLPLIWHFGGAGFTVLVLAFFYFTAPAWLAPRFRVIIPWIVLAIGVYLAGLTIGVKDEARRCAAQATANLNHEINLGSDARAQAEKVFPPVSDAAVGNPSGVRTHKLDKFDRD